MNMNISGLYKFVRNQSRKPQEEFELDLRIDVDGNRPMNIVSGDLYINHGKLFLNSFRFTKTRKKRLKNEVRIEGRHGEFSSDLKTFEDILIRIPIDSCPYVANVQWANRSGTNSACMCKYVSKYFRTIQLEQDSEVGTIPFKAYDTSSLYCPNLRRSRKLTIRNVFAEAGIRIQTRTNKQVLVPHPETTSGQGSIWTDNKLRKTMIKHFSFFKDKQLWKTWLFLALEYEISDLRGITLFHNGKRIGCAIFQNAIGCLSPQERRMLLFVFVHELGHCLNLKHPWNSSQTNSSSNLANYSTLSWMNYPWKYYSSKKSYGEEAFWRLFNFEFSYSELIHLRHAFRDDIIFGNKLKPIIE